MKVTKEEDIERLVLCSECKIENMSGYFLVEPGFQPKNKTKNCNRGSHSWNINLSELKAEKKNAPDKTLNHSSHQTLNFQHSTLNIQHSTFNVQNS